MPRTTRQKMVSHTLPEALAWLEARLLAGLTDAQCAQVHRTGHADAGGRGWRRADRAVQHGDLADAPSPGHGRGAAENPKTPQDQSEATWLDPLAATG